MKNLPVEDAGRLLKKTKVWRVVNMAIVNKDPTYGQILAANNNKHFYFLMSKRTFILMVISTAVWAVGPPHS